MYCYLSLAGIIIKIQYNYHKTYKYIERYVIDSDEKIESSIIIDLSRQKVLKSINTNKNFLKDRYNQDHNHSYVPYYTELNFEANALYIEIAELMPNFSTILMHGAVIAKNGIGYMFAGPSGIGKTTRAKLWIEEYPDSIIVNGDKPLIKVKDGEIMACGTPWCGKEGWNTNVLVPLKAIFFIERSTYNSYIERLNFGEAFPMLIQQTYHPNNKETLRKTLQLLKTIDGEVKIYRLISAPTSEAIRIAFETANKDFQMS